jgi:hypothetical protein
MSEREGTGRGPVIGGYKVLRDAAGEGVDQLPPPAGGKLVIALTPPARDGLAALRGEIRDVPPRETLMLLWEDRHGRRRLDGCDGVLVMGCGAEAPWLPERWDLGVFPTGLELPHLERWFDYAFSMIDALANRGDVPPDSERGHPMAPQPRELVAHAHRIVRHLGLPNPPIETRGPMTRAGCRADLEDVLQHLRRNLSAAPRPDGVEGGCWLWWQGHRHNIPKGNVYKLLAFMWGRDSAGYDALEGPVFDDPVQPQTIRSLANKLNKVLKKVGVPWRLSADSTLRQLTKHHTKQMGQSPRT